LTLIAMSSITTFAASVESDVVSCGGTFIIVPETGTEQSAPTQCTLTLFLNPAVLVNLLEPGSTSVVSDQVWTNPSSPDSFFFVSDNDPGTLSLTQTPDGFTTFISINNITETGGLQDVSSYFGFPNGIVRVFSETDVATPEPATLLMALPGLLALSILRVLKVRQ
jgi:hypothetical protein